MSLSSRKRRVSLLGIECSKGQTFHTKKTIICFKDCIFYNNYYFYFILGLHLRNMYLTTVISRQILVRYVYNYSEATLKLLIRTTVTLFITIASPLQRPQGALEWVICRPSDIKYNFKKKKFLKMGGGFFLLWAISVEMLVRGSQRYPPIKQFLTIPQHVRSFIINELHRSSCQQDPLLDTDIHPDTFI